jgi:hypothetical protein
MSSRKRVSSSEKSSSEFLKTTRNNSINAAINLLIAKKAENDGRLPHKMMQQVLMDLSAVGVVMNRQQMNYRISKQEKNHEENTANQLPIQEVDLNNLQTTCSLLTSNTSDSNDTSISGINRGRPVGSTITDQTKNRKERAACINEIAKDYAKEIERCKSNGKKPPITSYLI